MAAPHVTGAAALLAPAPSDLDAAAGQVGADVHGRPGLGRHGADEGGAVLLEGGGLINVHARRRPASSPTRLALVRRPERRTHGREAVARSYASPTRAAARARGRSSSAAVGDARRDDRRAAGRHRRRRAASATLAGHRDGAGGRAGRRRLRLRRPPPAAPYAPHPVRLLRHAARARALAAGRRCASSSSATRRIGAVARRASTAGPRRRSARRRATPARRWTRTAPSSSTSIARRTSRS